MKRKDFMLVVRKASPVIYKEFKKKAVERNVSVARALDMAMEQWIEHSEKDKRPDPKNMLPVIGMFKTRGKVRYSKQVDEILYGWKK